MVSIVGEIKEIITGSYSLLMKCKAEVGKIHDAYEVVEESMARFELWQPAVEKHLDEKNRPTNYKYFNNMMQNFKANLKKLIDLLKKWDKSRMAKANFLLNFFSDHLSELDRLVKSLKNILTKFRRFVKEMEQLNKMDANMAQVSEHAEANARALKLAASVEAKIQRELEKQAKREQALITKLFVTSALAKDQMDLFQAAKGENGEWEKVEMILVGMDEKVSRADAKRILKPLREQLRVTKVDEAKNKDLGKKISKGPKKGSGKDDGKLKPPPGNGSGSRSSSPAGEKVKKQPQAAITEDKEKLNPPRPSPHGSRPISPASDVNKKKAPPKVDQAAPDPPSGNSTTPGKPPTPQTPKMKHTWHIVCVDYTHGARAAMAQIHLEHTRLHTVNTTGHWLFNRVDSAGAAIQTESLSSAISQKVVTIKDIEHVPAAGPQSFLNETAIAQFEKSLGTSQTRETRALMERMRLTKRQGLKPRTLLDANHILCFGAYTHTVLQKLQAHALSLEPYSPGTPDAKKKLNAATITLLHVPFSTTTEDNDDAKTLAAVKEQVNGFLARELNWSPPKLAMWSGMYRSRQFCVPFKDKAGVLERRDRVVEKYGCKFVKVYTDAPERGVLVTVVGSMDAEVLENAEKELKGLPV